ncbi:hypothetical protein ACWGR4_01595 [Embleya sp. NPDC055664]
MADIVTPEDFAVIQRMARGYCRRLDASRSRKRMDGSATITLGGMGKYGTDDVSDDVTQDATIRFADRLRHIAATCEPSAAEDGAGGPQAWTYVRRDGEKIIATREGIMYWAVRDAAARVGYRSDIRPSEVDGSLDAHSGPGIPHVDKLSAMALEPALAGRSAEIFQAAWGNGSEYPTLKCALKIAEEADDLGRAGVIGRTAERIYGGPRNSSSKIRRTSDAARKELRELIGRLDEARDEMVYRGMRHES